MTQRRLITLSLITVLLLGCSKPMRLETPQPPAPAAAAPLPPAPIKVQITLLPQPLEARTRLHPTEAVAMVDAALGFGLGDRYNSNAILTTRDGGVTWVKVGVLPDDGPPWHNSWGWDARGVSFVNDREGWAVSPGGHLLHTTDGGKQWQPVNLPPGATTPVRVRFATPQKGCVQVDDQRMSVWWSMNGGTTWESYPGPGSIVGCARILAGTFGAAWDADYFNLLEARTDGLVLLTHVHGVPSTISASLDDGQHSQEYLWPGPLNLKAISFGTQKTGVALRSDRRLLFTKDGGATWQEAE
ncbi:MAG: WD40/YVTN/BNR-like repeat-containing protein [Mycobacterium leprae]